jgi:hypothetical protein
MTPASTSTRPPSRPASPIASDTASAGAPRPRMARQVATLSFALVAAVLVAAARAPGAGLLQPPRRVRPSPFCVPRPDLPEPPAAGRRALGGRRCRSAGAALAQERCPGAAAAGFSENAVPAPSGAARSACLPSLDRGACHPLRPPSLPPPRQTARGPAFRHGPRGSDRPAPGRVAQRAFAHWRVMAPDCYRLPAPRCPAGGTTRGLAKPHGGCKSHRMLTGRIHICCRITC